jgi:hypothetical protein
VNLLSHFSRLGHTAYFQTLRGAERVFGAGILIWMIAPEIILTCLERLKDYAQFRRLRAALPASFWKGLPALHHFVRMFCVWTTSLTVTLFYDRLNTPAWQKRITIRGTPPQSLPEWETRPVVIAFLHTGGFPILRYWLRAQRISAASYLGTLPRSFRHGGKFRDEADRVYGLSEVPHIFSGGKSLKEALRFLKPGCALMVALEERDFQEPHGSYSINGVSIGLNDVALRIARLAEAILIPAAVQATGPFQFEIKFGRPVPTNLMEEDAMTASNFHLLQELWPDLQQDPSAMTWTTLEALSPELRRPRGMWP